MRADLIAPSTSIDSHQPDYLLILIDLDHLLNKILFTHHILFHN